MDSFSWSDSLRALIAPCLECLRTSKSERNDLDELLVDSSSATTGDAETLSLHSNPGALAQRRRRSRFGKSIRLFGWDLFGRRQPIRLPDDDDEEEVEGEGEEGQRAQQQQQQRREAAKKKNRRPPPPAISSSTLDSDAAPLDSAAIVSHATKHAEEEEARAARRARRRERRERKQAALALEHAAVLGGDGEFEGFPGSGGRHAAAAVSDLSLSIDERDSTDSWTLPPSRHVPYRDDDEDEEDGDFGAGAYARRTPGSSDSGRGSDARSRTSTSLSGAQSAHAVQPYNHHYISQQPGGRSTAQASQPPPPPPARRTSKNKPSHSSSSSKRSRSSPSASQSPSIASPVAPQFSDAIVAPVPPSTVPRAGQEGDGLKSGPSLHTAGIERLSSGFPSPGLGGPRNGKRDMGAFLANRGGD